MPAMETATGDLRNRGGELIKPTFALDHLPGGRHSSQIFSFLTERSKKNRTTFSLMLVSHLADRLSWWGR
jgi:hypothetical protein